MGRVFSSGGSSANTVVADDECSNSEKNDEVQASRWTRAKPYCFCCMRYGCACIIGALIAVAIILIVLWQIGLFGGKKGSPSTVIDLGELLYPRVTSGYTEVNVTLSPVAAALTYKPKYFLLESQPAASASGRFLADTDGWGTVHSKVNYESVPVVAQIAGLTAGASFIVRYRIEMEDGRLSSPSVSVLASLLPPAPPSAPGLAAYNTSTSSVSVIMVPPASVHGSNVTSYSMRYKVGSSTNWTSETIQAEDATTPFTVSGLSPQQNVAFTLTAFNGIGSSPSSAEYSMRSDADSAAVPGKVNQQLH
ncbi:hypothetical protein FOL47_010852 [Perkinsus chesapeaki]|uniref:Fibronectin type-III domain-containing protein n=1 Tax=Perkinsus chesapeaki TaxID=330153 RepID=A0A7J6L0U8_PERCH|nr:hypothetical protein FOL47_010852 [Perkinsus chesapeaki]